MPINKQVNLLDILPSKVSSTSDVKRVIVIRAEDISQNREEKEVYDLEKFFKEGDETIASVPIHDGDLIFVPDKKKGVNILRGGFNGLFSIINLTRLLF